jgi:uncharacterized repeat protein (TIGR04138 family)
MATKQSGPQKPIEQIVAEMGRYAIEAFEFVQRGLHYTVQKLHEEAKDPDADRHVTGRELSQGLRELALVQWGLLARTVLRRWGITRTEDFGRIVFALVDSGWMSKTQEDTLDDFKDVFDFADAFENGYRIECKS